MVLQKFTFLKNKSNFNFNLNFMCYNNDTF